MEQVLERVEILNPDGNPRTLEDAPLLQSLQGQGKIVRGEEITRHRATGHMRCRQFSSSPVRYQQGEIIGAVAVVKDITDQKKNEADLRSSGMCTNSLYALKTPSATTPCTCGCQFRRSP